MNLKLLKKLFICLFLILLISSCFLSCSFADESIPDIYSPSALLMDSSSGKILYEKNINEKMYPASLTKILTAIIVLENCKLDDIVTVSYDAVMSIKMGYVTANLQIGEELTVEQLLYVLMVGSSNDSAIVLAEHVSGSVEDFSKLMNEKAKEIGCKNTNFVNPNGEHNENHYSTAYDLALIARYAMQNNKFRELVSTTSYTLPATNKYEKEDRFFTTTNSLLISSDKYYYKYAIGVKTGFTTPAGNCLIASSNKENLELITVVLGAGQTEDGSSQRYLDTISLFEYGYNNYILQQIIKNGSTVQTINVKNATRDTKKLDAIISNDIFALTKKENKNNTIVPEITFNESLKAPIKKGDIIGSVKYSIEGLDYTENLLASNDVKKSHWLIKLITFILIVLICCFYLRLKKLKKKNKHNRRKLIKKYGGTI